MDINVKAKSLLIKSMLRQRNKDQDIKSMYGYEDKLEGILEKCDSMTPVKVIYAEMVKEVYEKNGSVIPSRNEKKVRGIKWSNTWENLEKSKGLNAGEKVKSGYVIDSRRGTIYLYSLLYFKVSKIYFIL